MPDIFIIYFIITYSEQKKMKKVQITYFLSKQIVICDSILLDILILHLIGEIQKQSLMLQVIDS